MSKILIVDPLTLLGREVLQLLPSDLDLPGPVTMVHTADDDEHQITDIAGEPALVPPLTEPEELAEGDIILVTSESETRRGNMVGAYLDDHPATPAVVVGATRHLDAMTVPVAFGSAVSDHRHIRVPDPALVMLATVCNCLRDLSPERATVAAEEPVSVRGREQVEQLARQAAQRLQGAEVDETIDDLVLAFNTVAADGERLGRDAASVLPDIPVAVTRSYSSCFHGHVAHLGLVFPQPVSEHEVVEALRADDRLDGPELPVALDERTDSNVVALGAPQFSGDLRSMAVTAMADGLRIGGAYTALEIVRALT